MRRGLFLVLSLLLHAQAPPPSDGGLPAYAPPPGAQTGRFEGNTMSLLRAGAPVFVGGMHAGQVQDGGRLDVVLPAGNWVVDLHETSGFDRVDFDARDSSQPKRVGPLHVWPGATTTWELGTSGHSLVHVVPDLPPRQQFTQAQKAAVVADLCTRRLGVRTAKGQLTALYDLTSHRPLQPFPFDAASPGLIAATPLADSPAANEPFAASCTWRDRAPIGLPSLPTDKPGRHHPQYALECTGHFGRDLARPAYTLRVDADERLAGSTWYVDAQAGAPVVVHFAAARPPPAAEPPVAKPVKAPARGLWVLLFTARPLVSPQYLAPRTPPGCR